MYKNHLISSPANAIGKTIVKKEKNKIIDIDNLKNTGIILMDDEIMQKIKKQSGPLADSCEYQVHYWALVVRATASDDSILDICIPTVFFNYKQEVSGARIDFELSDVDDVSNQLLPIHDIKVSELLIDDGIVNRIKTILPDTREVTLISRNLNSIHKHPGGIHQNFSGTDLAKDHKDDTGIVFPLAIGNKDANFAGIMAHVQGKNKIAHYEYRLATGAVGEAENDTITYEKGRCISLVRALQTPAIEAVPPSETESLFGLFGKPAINPKDNSYLLTDKLTKLSVESLPLITSLFDAWKKTGFEPFVEAVFPKNIARKTYTAQRRAWQYPKSTAVKATSKTTSNQRVGINDYFGKPSANDDYSSVGNDFGEEYNLMFDQEYGTDTEQFDSPEKIAAEEIVYMERISKLEWLSEEELKTIDVEALKAKTQVLDTIYIGYSNPVEYIGITKETLTEDYIDAMESIQYEIDINDYLDSDPIMEGARTLCRTDIIEDLLKMSADKKKVETASFDQLKAWHRATSV